MKDKLRWGILGIGGIAQRQMIPAIAGARNGIVSFLGTRRPEAVQDIAANLAECAVGSYDELLANPSVDAVYIALPNAHHAEWALKAAQAGKPVLCEKPLATSAADARRVVDAFSARDLPLMEGFMYRFHPQHHRVRELVREGAIGDLREVHAHLSVNHSKTTDVQNVRFRKDTGGGALMDMGCYTISVARWMFGEEPLNAVASRDIDKDHGSDTSFAAILGWSNGRRGLVSVSFHAGGQGFYTLVGSDGSIHVPRAIIPGVGNRLADTLLVVSDVNGARREEVFPPAPQYRLMIEAFAAAVLGRRPLPFSAKDALGNALVMDAVVKAAESGEKTAVGTI